MLVQVQIDGLASVVRNKMGFILIGVRLLFRYFKRILNVYQQDFRDL